jgi:hypothetical protein
MKRAGVNAPQRIAPAVCALRIVAPEFMAPRRTSTTSLDWGATIAASWYGCQHLKPRFSKFAENRNVRSRHHGISTGAYGYIATNGTTVVRKERARVLTRRAMRPPANTDECIQRRLPLPPMDARRLLHNA